jgi:hypothetical protein
MEELNKLYKYLERLDKNVAWKDIVSIFLQFQKEKYKGDSYGAIDKCLVRDLGIKNTELNRLLEER